MNSIIAARPTTALPTLRATLAQPATSAIPRRSHQTTARTKRALRIRPHPSHLLRNRPAAPNDEILFNPPSSQPSVYHTPFKFLPASDPRRSSNLKLLFPEATAGSAPDYLPPAITPEDPKKYHLSKADVEEMRRLRWEDPDTWSLKKLAAKFQCSVTFVQIAAEVKGEYRAKLAEEWRRKRALWGPKKLKAREERDARLDMLFRGEI